MTEILQKAKAYLDARRGERVTLGELAQAVRKGTSTEQLHELGDVLAWLASLANQLGLP